MDEESLDKPKRRPEGNTKYTLSSDDGELRWSRTTMKASTRVTTSFARVALVGHNMLSGRY